MNSKDSSTMDQITKKALYEIKRENFVTEIIAYGMILSVFAAIGLGAYMTYTKKIGPSLEISPSKLEETLRDCK